ncbi:Transcriptional repressor SdpR [Phycisphaerales bacterium]|nr:Transcriptional repressor SdpR [Phycisphaerales bacterium]
MTRPAADTVFQAIADPTRRAILHVLRDGERTAGDLVERFEISQPAVSQHLGVLRRAGLVDDRKVGRFRVYSLRVQPLLEVVGWISEFDRLWTVKLDALGRHLAAARDAKGDA